MHVELKGCAIEYGFLEFFVFTYVRGASLAQELILKYLYI